MASRTSLPPVIIIDDHYPVGWCGPALARAAAAKRRMAAIEPLVRSGRLKWDVRSYPAVVQRDGPTIPFDDFMAAFDLSLPKGHIPQVGT